MLDLFNAIGDLRRTLQAGGSATFAEAVTGAVAASPDPDSVAALAQHFIRRQSAYTSTDAGLTALQFEALLMQQFPAAQQAFVETTVDGDAGFRAVFLGPLPEAAFAEMQRVAAPYMKLVVEVVAGDVDDERAMVSDFTIIRGEPVKQGEKTEAVLSGSVGGFRASPMGLPIRAVLGSMRSRAGSPLRGFRKRGRLRRFGEGRDYPFDEGADLHNENPPPLRRHPLTPCESAVDERVPSEPHLLSKWFHESMRQAEDYAKRLAFLAVNWERAVDAERKVWGKGPLYATGKPTRLLRLFKYQKNSYVSESIYQRMRDLFDSYFSETARGVTAYDLRNALRSVVNAVADVATDKTLARRVFSDVRDFEQYPAKEVLEYARKEYNESDRATVVGLIEGAYERIPLLGEVMRWLVNFHRDLSAWYNRVQRTTVARRPDVPPDNLPDTFTLYHATPYVAEILRDGFKVNKGGGIGGSTDDAISFTGNRDIAVAIADALRFAIDIANGKKTADDILRWAGKVGADMKYVRRRWDAESAAAKSAHNVRGDERQRLFKLFTDALSTSRTRYDPLFFGVDVAQFAGRKPTDAGVIAARVRKDGMVKYLLGMDEYRVKPEAIVSLQRLRESCDGPTVTVLDEALTQVAVKTITTSEAMRKGMFGPVYHGTTQDNRSRIDKEGFRIFVGDPVSGAIRHGYEGYEYALGLPPPVHHLGYGVYFTTVKSIAKRFNGNSARGLKPYYLDVPRIETINFASPQRMMEWWIRNGYDPALVKVDRVLATAKLTAQLASRYDAVWFKGRGLRTLLDGDQIVVFDPSRIYRVDDSQAKFPAVGSKVRRKAIRGWELNADGTRAVGPDGRGIQEVLPGDGMKGTIVAVRDIRPEARSFHPEGATRFLAVRWARGGTDHNVYDIDVEPLA